MRAQRKKRKKKTKTNDDDDIVDNTTATPTTTEDSRLLPPAPTIPHHAPPPSSPTPTPSSPPPSSPDWDSDSEEHPSSHHGVRIRRTLEIKIKRADTLEPDVRMTHPRVRVHLVEEETGKPLRRKTGWNPIREEATPGSPRSPRSHRDMMLGADDVIGPMETGGCNFVSRHVFDPVWETPLPTGVLFKDVVVPGVVVLFEIVDCGGINDLDLEKGGKDVDGWHRVAWAFLKVAPSPDRVHVSQALRLQLFQYPKHFVSKYVKTGEEGGEPAIYRYYASTQGKKGRKKRKPYPSTLYASLDPVHTPMIHRSELEAAVSSGSLVPGGSVEDLLLGSGPEAGGGEGGDGDALGSGADAVDEMIRHWPRVPGQKCKVPNVFHRALDAGSHGAFALKWSASGEMLAAAIGSTDSYPIRVYSYDGEALVDLIGHEQLVYELAWWEQEARGVGLLLSASADGTAKLWSVNRRSGAGRVLTNYQHTCFVYTAQFHPTASSPPVVATGAFDWIIRMFHRDTGEILREIAGHSSTVNSLVFSRDGNQMFSGDGAGIVRVWSSRTDDAGTLALKDVSRIKTLDMGDVTGISGTPINVLRIHPTANRLLIHGRSNSIVEVELRWFKVMYRQEGFVNEQFEIRSAFSPCGNFVISGSEDGSVYVWDVLQNGRIRQIFAKLPFQFPVYGLDWHPRAHVLAFSSYGEGAQPLLLFKYDAAALPGADTLGAQLAEVAAESAQDHVTKSELESQKDEIERLIRTREELKAEQVGRILQSIMDEISLARQRNDMPRLDARRRRRLRSAQKKRRLRFADDADGHEYEYEYEGDEVDAELQKVRDAEDRVLARKFYNKTKDSIADHKIDSIDAKLRVYAERDDETSQSLNESLTSLVRNADFQDRIRSQALTSSIKTLSPAQVAHVEQVVEALASGASVGAAPPVPTPSRRPHTSSVAATPQSVIPRRRRRRFAPDVATSTPMVSGSASVRPPSPPVSPINLHRRLNDEDDGEDDDDDDGNLSIASSASSIASERAKHRGGDDENSWKAKRAAARARKREELRRNKRV